MISPPLMPPRRSGRLAAPPFPSTSVGRFTSRTMCASLSWFCKGGSDWPPEAQHAAIPTLGGAVDMSPRSLLARDIWNLRRYTNTPNSSLQQLIELNKTMYPERLGHDTRGVCE